jgi:hypothetical protein
VVRFNESVGGWILHIPKEGEAEVDKKIPSTKT